jgi:HEPN domain-containing protein
VYSNIAASEVPGPAGSPTEASRWLAKAGDDLTVATVVLERAGGVNWAACFHAQQATEKALKALLVAFGIDFPRSHALERLLALLPARIAAEFNVEAVAELTPWAVAGRYPEDIPNPDFDTTRRLIESARTMFDRAEGIIEHLVEDRHFDDACRPLRRDVVDEGFQGLDVVVG